MDKKLHISVSPHFHAKVTTQSIMLDVILALLPTTIAGVLIFGVRSLAVIAVSVGFSVLSEFVFNKLAKKPMTIQDLSAVVTGLLLALTLPVNIALWEVAIGAIFAIVVVKGFFGGIGQNFANPAITGRVFMLVAFGDVVSAKSFVGKGIVDTTASATPLANMATAPTSMIDLLLGTHAGAIGEVCTVALLLGFVYLLIKKVITFHTPVVFIAVVFLLTLLITKDVNTALAYSMSGGLFIGAIFMATDYATTPTRPWGKVIFAVGCAVITVLIRMYGNLPEGVSYAILLMNILTPYIDKWTEDKPFGGEA
ncbi:MAG: RnfABCDGE type electron transport complex subunit D [Lachnospiraceae bacterium]|nr:RnfABCDGE type electron transport complex subunit D [Lachnospiraceae bacterium]